MTIDLAEGDPAEGNLVVDSPLALAGAGTLLVGCPIGTAEL